MLPTMLLPLVLLFTLPFSHSLDCYNHPARTRLPNLHHCENLVRAINIASRIPHHNDRKIWGRGLPSNAHTEELPKTYVYAPAGEPPQTCALDLDADPLNLQAREVFRLQDVVTAAARIVKTCLSERSMLGRDPVGPTGRVYAKLARADSPLLLQVGRPGKGGSGGGAVQSLAIPGMGGELHWVSIEARNRSLS